MTRRMFYYIIRVDPADVRHGRCYRYVGEPLRWISQLHKECKRDLTLCEFISNEYVGITFSSIELTR